MICYLTDSGELKVGEDAGRDLVLDSLGAGEPRHKPVHPVKATMSDPTRSGGMFSSQAGGPCRWWGVYPRYDPTRTSVLVSWRLMDDDPIHQNCPRKTADWIRWSVISDPQEVRIEHEDFRKALAPRIVAKWLLAPSLLNS